MTLLHPFSGTEAKAKGPINEDLTDKKYKENIEDLATQVDGISGGASGGGIEDTGAVGEIILGGQSNEPIYWKRRFSCYQHMLAADNKNITGFDPEGKLSKNVLLTFLQTNDGGITLQSDALGYQGKYLRVAKSSQFSFKVKKGVNFFSFIHPSNTGSSSNMEVTINGQTPTSLGLVDENGNASGDSFSNLGSLFYQNVKYFFGLDPETEYIVTVLNNDAGTATGFVDAIEVGYRSVDYTIDETVRIEKGIARVRGAEVSFDAEEFTAGKPEHNGHTAAIVADTLGNLELLDGECPAMTQVKAEEDISFSSTVTTLPVKTNLRFPDNGICMLSVPYGNHHFFSYNGKTDTTPQTNSLDSILWQSQPTEDYTPLSGLGGPSTGDGFGDLNINYWGTAPILIDSSNNKLDFVITENGVTTTHVATIPSGRYAADIVRLGEAVVTAMKAVKDIEGEYRLIYNALKHKWYFQVVDKNVTEFRLLFQTGVNFANSIHPVIGFNNADLTGDLGYIGDNEVEHLSAKVFQADAAYMSAYDPRIKLKQTDSGEGVSAASLDTLGRLNIGPVWTAPIAGAFLQIHVDPDCSGIELLFQRETEGTVIIVQIDDGPQIFLTQFDAQFQSNTFDRTTLLSGFLSFPRGSKKITAWLATSFFEIGANTERMQFAGARQYFTKPAWEKLPTNKAVIKTFDVSPQSLYATPYGHNGGTLYSPAASDDNINTITESPAWSGSTASAYFNQGYRDSTTFGQYVDINFTLQGDGGGVLLKGLLNTVNTFKAGVFISNTTINESTDRITNFTQFTTFTVYDAILQGHLGLKAGTYTIRFKNEWTNVSYDNLQHWGIIVVDTVPPQANANTITDINNTGQGVAYPINVVREAIHEDSAYSRTFDNLIGTGYKEGRVSNVHYSLNSPTFNNVDISASLTVEPDKYYFNSINENIINHSVSILGFMKSVTLMEGCFTSHGALQQGSVDGVSFLNTHDQGVQVKGGTSPSATRFSYSYLCQKQFKLSCTFASGNTFNVSDTRGIRVGEKIILNDGTNKEIAIVQSIVVGVSFTVKEARSVVVDGSVTEFEFQGFHTFKVQAGDALISDYSSFDYEPLKINKSKALARLTPTFEYEKVSVTHTSISNQQDAYYPVHSDGIPGDWRTSKIQLVTQTGSAFNLREDLKNIDVGSGVIDLKIDSEREVFVEKDEWEY